MISQHMYTVEYKRSVWFYCVKNVYGQQCLNKALTNKTILLCTSGPNTKSSCLKVLKREQSQANSVGSPQS